MAPTQSGPTKKQTAHLRASPKSSMHRTHQKIPVSACQSLPPPPPPTLFGEGSVTEFHCVCVFCAAAQKVLGGGRGGGGGRDVRSRSSSSSSSLVLGVISSEHLQKKRRMETMERKEIWFLCRRSADPDLASQSTTTSLACMCPVRALLEVKSSRTVFRGFTDMGICSLLSFIFETVSR